MSATEEPGPPSSSAPEVTDHPDRKRYEVAVDGVVAGYAAYEMSSGTVVFTHTVIEPQFEGRGLGSAVARYALDDARRRGLAVVPRCPFIHRFIERHPDYADLVKG
jgi:predicted GNAT family acetyltransferase